MIQIKRTGGVLLVVIDNLQMVEKVQTDMITTDLVAAQVQRMVNFSTSYWGAGLMALL